MSSIIKIVLTFVHAKKEISMRKIKFCGFLFICGWLCLASSCLGGSDKLDEWLMGNAQIASFSLKSDSISGLADVKFAIDQVNGLIFNRDSMPFRTRIDEFKVIATVGFDSPLGVRNLLIIEQATGDTIKSVEDSISFVAPVKMTVTAYDGISTKSYEVKLNVHQVNPDTMVWEKYADIFPGRTFQDMKVLSYKDSCYMYVVENAVFQLYKSHIEDLKNWEKLDLKGFPNKAVLSQLTLFQDSLLAVISEEGALYLSSDGQNWTQAAIGEPIKALLGFLPESKVSGRADVLCVIVEVAGDLRFMTIDNQLECIQGQIVPESFPVSGYGQFQYETMYFPRLAIASGRDTQNRVSDKAWATMNGLSWALLTNPKKTFSVREGASFFYYGYAFFLIGGIADYGLGLKDIQFSVDQGVTWIQEYYVYNEESEDYELHSIYLMPEEFTPRGFASVIVDKANYMLLFGGKARPDTNVLNEIWRGRINRLGFGMSR